MVEADNRQYRRTYASSGTNLARSRFNVEYNQFASTHSQMKLFNRNFAVGERIEYMGWVNEGVINNNISWQSYKPRFLVLKGTEVLLFDSPPVRDYLFD